MNASLSAALLLLLLSGGWFLGRRRSRPFLRSTDTAAVAALNRTQIERLHARASSVTAAVDSLLTAAPPAAEAAPASMGPGEGASPFLLPLQPRQRRRWLLQLQFWMVGSREQRLQALAMASESGRLDVLPVLRLGLRDPDPAVMAAAAAAMVRFRGRTTVSSVGSAALTTRRGPAQPGWPATLRPRKVLRIR